MDSTHGRVFVQGKGVQLQTLPQPLGKGRSYTTTGGYSCCSTGGNRRSWNVLQISMSVDLGSLRVGSHTKRTRMLVWAKLNCKRATYDLSMAGSARGLHKTQRAWNV